MTLQIVGRPKIHYSTRITPSTEASERYCFDPSTSNDGDTILVTVDGIRDNKEKIKWYARLVDGKEFTGGSITFMTFEFHKKDNGIYVTQRRQVS